MVSDGGWIGWIEPGCSFLYLDLSDEEHPAPRAFDVDTGRSRPPDPGSLAGPIADDGLEQVAVAPDGKTLFYLTGRSEADIWLAEIE